MPEPIREHHSRVSYLYDTRHPPQKPPKPFIRLSGYYLAQYGFPIGAYLDVTISENQIVIRRLSSE